MEEPNVFDGKIRIVGVYNKASDEVRLAIGMEVGGSETEGVAILDMHEATDLACNLIQAGIQVFGGDFGDAVVAVMRERREDEPTKH